MRGVPSTALGDPLIRLIVVNWILGALAGATCAAILLILDLGHLRSLLVESDLLVQGLLLLFGGFMVTFGGVVCATALMTATASAPPTDR